ncbi:1-pyrroline-5-carboxylate dehydrogenase, partial [Nowakowskiella sp. JEL0078]
MFSRFTRHLMLKFNGAPLHFQLSKYSSGQSPQLGFFSLPEIKNEIMMDYAVGSPERAYLRSAVDKMRSDLEKNGPYRIEPFQNLQFNSSDRKTQVIPFEHKTTLATFPLATKETINQAIEASLRAKPAWEAMPFNDRAAIFLKAADLLSSKYRYEVLAATMLGQGKNVWQAEIDAAAELCDFWRFNCKYAAEIYADQPPENSPKLWNRVEYRPLEGFIAAYSPFNFTAIGGNLASAPALMGNVVFWKPSLTSMYSNWLVHQILLEAGLPKDVIQFVPGDAELITN